MVAFAIAMILYGLWQYPRVTEGKKERYIVFVMAGLLLAIVNTDRVAQIIVLLFRP